MKIPKPIFGRSAVINVHFDGSTVENPGKSGWGAVLSGFVYIYPPYNLIPLRFVREKEEGKEEDFRMQTPRRVPIDEKWSGPLGHTTSNVAACLAAIEVLRTIKGILKFRGVLPPATAVHMRCDSLQLVQHMTEDVAVTDRAFRHCAAALRGVLSHFTAVKFEAVLREQNVEADKLASYGRCERPHPLFIGRFVPARFGVLEALVDGVWTLASHDFGMYTSDARTAGNGPDGRVYIDAGLVEQLPAREDRPVLQLLMYERSVRYVDARGEHLSVLGCVDVAVTLFWPDDVEIKKSKVRAVVLEQLPVPLHMSTVGVNEVFVPRGPGEKEEVGGAQLSVSFVSEEYKEHKFWTASEGSTGM